MVADEFLEFAERIIADPESGAAALRSAISRSYYATFHATVAVQRQLGGRVVASHDVIGDRFLTSPDPEVRRIGQSFLNLKTSRNHADYRLTGPAAANVEDLESARGLVMDARVLITDVRSLRSGHLRTAAQEAVLEDDKRRFG